MTIKNFILLLGISVLTTPSLQGVDDDGLGDWGKAADSRNRGARTSPHSVAPFVPTIAQALVPSPKPAPLAVPKGSSSSTHLAPSPSTDRLSTQSQSKGTEEIDDSHSADLTIEPSSAPLSFRYFSLKSGFKKGPKDYDDESTKKLYYDASGVFPPLQPPFNALKNAVSGAGEWAWKKECEAENANYRLLQQELKRKAERLERKTKEFEALSQQKRTGRDTPPPSSMMDSVLMSPPPSPQPLSSSSSTSSLASLSSSSSSSLVGAEGAAASSQPVKNSPEAILSRAQIDYEKAKQEFEKAKAKLQARHMIKVRESLIPLEGDQLDELVYQQSIPLVIPYHRDPHSLTGDKRSKAFTITDIHDLRVAVHILEWLTAHLFREMDVFRALKLGNSRDFEPKVQGGYLSFESWKNWSKLWEIFNLLQKAFISRFPSPDVGKGQRDLSTERGQILAATDRDERGAIVRKILQKIKPLKDEGSVMFEKQIDAQFRLLSEAEGSVAPLNVPFSMRYVGADDSAVSMPTMTLSTTKNNIQRTFSKPLPASYVVPTVRKYSHESGSDELSRLNVFLMPKGTKGATDYRAPELIRAHREVWIDVLKELVERKSSVLAKPIWDGEYLKMILGKYNTLCALYTTALETQTTFLADIKRSITSSYLPSSYLDMWDLPSPLRFFVVVKPPTASSVTEQKSAEMKLIGYQVEDGNLFRRILHNGQWIFVLSPYETLDLSQNNLRAPRGEAFGNSLRKLTLSNNDLRNLDSLTPVLSQLVELDVSSNRLGDGSINALSYATKLTTLSLAENGMTNFYLAASLTQLLSLDISGNNATNISYLSSLVGLTSLKANHLGVKGKWEEALPFPLPALKSLELQRNILLALSLNDMHSVHNKTQSDENDRNFQKAFPVLAVLKAPLGEEWRQGDDKQPITLSKVFGFLRGPSKTASARHQHTGGK
ncbi:MAG: leucine-rich repeat domain-containing protein [Alphaproteobacteria bacterium]|nr:leucine-rich repeat domain-containing protein [Alphaproteobacteria bacterium]